MKRKVTVETLRNVKFRTLDLIAARNAAVYDVTQDGNADICIPMTITLLLDAALETGSIENLTFIVCPEVSAQLHAGNYIDYVDMNDDESVAKISGQPMQVCRDLPQGVEVVHADGSHGAPDIRETWILSDGDNVPFDGMACAETKLVRLITRLPPKS